MTRSTVFAIPSPARTNHPLRRNPRRYRPPPWADHNESPACCLPELIVKSASGTILRDIVTRLGLPELPRSPQPDHPSSGGGSVRSFSNECYGVYRRATIGAAILRIGCQGSPQVRPRKITCLHSLAGISIGGCATPKIFSAYFRSAWSLEKCPARSMLTMTARLQA
jgi:hypothetical protein